VTTLNKIGRPDPGAIFALIAVLFLTGCTTATNVTDFFTKPPILPCPDFRVLADAADYTTYRSGPGRDLTDVNFEGNIDNMRVSCLTLMDRDTKIGTMEVDVVVDFIAQRGPANKDRKATFPYFISVTDLDKKILYREEFNISVDFEGNRTGIGFRNKPVTLQLDLKPNVTGRNYIVFTGFKVNKEQLQFNRERRRQITR